MRCPSALRLGCKIAGKSAGCQLIPLCVSDDEAEERAARTVNKERREHGETKAQKEKSRS